MYSQIRKTIKEYDMISAEDKVLVGVSGGADSVFLLNALVYLKKELMFDIYVANIDHGLRGKESSQESLFVKNLCKEKGIEYFTTKLCIKKDKKYSIEEVARKKRYAFFEKTAKQNKMNKIATAHNLDDQAETVLMRVIKGTSLRGLTGIPPVRKEKAITYIRPMIELSKKDVLDVLKKGKIEFKEDSSNKEEIYFRNIVRKKILPYLEKYNPNIIFSLSRMAESLREDKDFIDSGKKKLEQIMNCRKEKNKVEIPLSRIYLLSNVMQKEIIKDILDDVGANLKKLSFVHWKQIRELLKNGQTGKELQMPGKVTVCRTKTALVIRRTGNRT